MQGSSGTATVGHPPEPTRPETPPDIPGPAAVGTVRLPNGLGTDPPISQQPPEPHEPASPEVRSCGRDHFSTEATPRRPQPGVNGTANSGASSLAPVYLDPAFPRFQSERSSNTIPAGTLRLAFLGTAFEPGELCRNGPLSPSVRPCGSGSTHNSQPPEMIFGYSGVGVAGAIGSDFPRTPDTHGVGSWCPEADDINIVWSLSEENGLEDDSGCQ